MINVSECFCKRPIHPWQRSCPKSKKAKVIAHALCLNTYKKCSRWASEDPKFRKWWDRITNEEKTMYYCEEYDAREAREDRQMDRQEEREEDG